MHSSRSGDLTSLPTPGQNNTRSEMHQKREELGVLRDVGALLARYLHVKCVLEQHEWRRVEIHKPFDIVLHWKHERLTKG